TCHCIFLLKMTFVSVLLKSIVNISYFRNTKVEQSFPAILYKLTNQRVTVPTEPRQEQKVLPCSHAKDLLLLSGESETRNRHPHKQSLHEVQNKSAPALGLRMGTAVRWGLLFAVQKESLSYSSSESSA